MGGTAEHLIDERADFLGQLVAGERRAGMLEVLVADLERRAAGVRWIARGEEISSAAQRVDIAGWCREISGGTLRRDRDGSSSAPPAVGAIRLTCLGNRSMGKFKVD